MQDKVTGNKNFDYAILRKSLSIEICLVQFETVTHNREHSQAMIFIGESILGISTGTLTPRPRLTNIGNPMKRFKQIKREIFDLIVIFKPFPIPFSNRRTEVLSAA